MCLSTLFLLLLKPSRLSPWWPSLSVYSCTCDSSFNPVNSIFITPSEFLQALGIFLMKTIKLR